jgi:aminoglycoside phosphotransferase family enzyme/predicted kinase
MSKVSDGLANDSNTGLALIKALHSAGPYSHAIDPVRLVETHISWVLLTGHYAYKIKKPVNFGFLDFSTLEKRRFCCAEEIRLNRRLAPDIYLEVVPITGTPNEPKIDGAGDAIEYAVKMVQFSEGALLSELAEYKKLVAEEIDQIAGVVADFHQIIEQAGGDSPYGNAPDIKHWFDENFAQIRPLLDVAHDRQQIQAIQQWGDDEWSRKSALMQLRKQQGFVRECHGDLHLSNITLIDGKITLFDCIEFNPMLRWIDVISEVAFLMIDLLYFGYEGLAFRFLNRYLQNTGDYQSLGLIRYYLVYRALVLAKVSILRMQQCQDSDYLQARERFTAFMNLAEGFTRTVPPVLMITHGYSGSGKSTFAALLSETIGALQLCSDIERKRLFGYRPQDNTGSDIDSGIYTQEAGMKTYRRLADLAKSVLDAGFPVIVDATFLEIGRRDQFRTIAAALAVPFVILDFKVPDEELAGRIRLRNNDASEATVEVLHQQQQSAQPLSLEESTNAITIANDYSNALDSCLAKVAESLK